MGLRRGFFSESEKYFGNFPDYAGRISEYDFCKGAVALWNILDIITSGLKIEEFPVCDDFADSIEVEMRFA